ncbi:type I restriction-modification system subunit M [Mycoplasma sp. E35C]|uniref:type I restriction-modification system subunit M n=1 Tax=Mycoplasma sp. E35C TaxID=2801918 RepID=UPI001CA3B700|nr:type I restriction-modification system subunit M [Mycoplasma sp. E35C]QZX48906.1 type I restriction-modification system subunit M [Mycoplasma sp. E35C]
MTKQELASKIWDFCNTTRMMFDSHNYKDVLLGLIFYKFLSDDLEREYERRELSKEEIKELDEPNKSKVVNNTYNAIYDRVHYFIRYDYLFSSWIEKMNEFSINLITDSLNYFNENIHHNYLKVYKDIFKNLYDNLKKLDADKDNNLSKVRQMIEIINEIPTHRINQNYDVLGYVYEYLLNKFNTAGKKSGQFYTPHEISTIMSEIAIASLNNKKEISIYDPTSGSGSLLINIGTKLKFATGSKVNRTKTSKKETVNVTYYAQEILEAPYNLTRMNLVMNGVNPSLINVNKGDTLDKDWPFIVEGKPKTVDCVVANPPYSISWIPSNKTNDPRFRGYGLAPAKKRADFAFLLHCLYHLESDGIMQIVMPHGVLFRGNSEYDIRKNLIEKNNIETIIGLPEKIFANTGIPTCIIILRKKRDNKKQDVLFIDASQEFVKENTTNVLLGCHTKKIVDAVIARKDIPYFARLVDKSEIVKNDYNLNISKYVTTTKSESPYDLYSTIYGTIPNNEIDEFNDYWDVFYDLKDLLFKKNNQRYSVSKNSEIYDAIEQSESVENYKNECYKQFEDFASYLTKKIIEEDNDKYNDLREEIDKELFTFADKIKLIDKYKIFNEFDSRWNEIINDKSELKESLNKIDWTWTKSVKDKNPDKGTPQGRILPIDLVQQTLLIEKINKIRSNEELSTDISNQINCLLEELELEYRDAFYSEDDKKIAISELNDIVHEIFTDNNIKCAKTKIKQTFDDKFDEIIKSETLSTSERKVLEIYQLFYKRKDIDSINSGLQKELKNETVTKIQEINYQEAKPVFVFKWIEPIIKGMKDLVDEQINDFVALLTKLINKYNNPMNELKTQIDQEEKELVALLKELEADKYDQKAIDELISLLDK